MSAGDGSGVNRHTARRNGCQLLRESSEEGREDSKSEFQDCSNLLEFFISSWHLPFHIGIMAVTERMTEGRGATGRQRPKYLDSLCASRKDNVSPTYLVEASGGVAWSPTSSTIACTRRCLTGSSQQQQQQQQHIHSNSHARGLALHVQQ